MISDSISYKECGLYTGSACSSVNLEADVGIKLTYVR